MKYNPQREELAPLMEALEEKRQFHLKAKSRAQYIYLGPIAFLGLTLLASLAFGLSILICFLIFFAWMLLVKTYLVDSHYEEYNKAYKEDLIQPFTQLFFPKVNYLPGKFVTSNHIQASFLYDMLVYRARASCEDGFRGRTTEGLDFTLIEVDYWGEVHGKMETQRELFISIELPQKGYRPVIVSKGGIMKSIVARYNEKNPEEEPMVKQLGFEEHFKRDYTVYSQKEEDASSLLTASFVALIQKLEAEWKGALRYSFVEDVLHIALPSSHNYFEADAEKIVSVDSLGKELFEELSTCLAIVEAFASSLNGLKMPIKERIPLPKDLDLSAENWDDSAYDHFIDN